MSAKVIVDYRLAHELLGERYDALAREFVRFYDSIDRAQKIDNTGGDSAVSVALWSWAPSRAAHAAGLSERDT